MKGKDFIFRYLFIYLLHVEYLYVNYSFPPSAELAKFKRCLKKFSNSIFLESKDFNEEMFFFAYFPTYHRNCMWHLVCRIWTRSSVSQVCGIWWNRKMFVEEKKCVSFLFFFSQDFISIRISLLRRFFINCLISVYFPVAKYFSQMKGIFIFIRRKSRFVETLSMTRYEDRSEYYGRSFYIFCNIIVSKRLHWSSVKDL